MHVSMQLHVDRTQAHIWSQAINPLGADATTLYTIIVLAYLGTSCWMSLLVGRLWQADCDGLTSTANIKHNNLQHIADEGGAVEKGVVDWHASKSASCGQSKHMFKPYLFLILFQVFAAEVVHAVLETPLHQRVVQPQAVIHTSKSNGLDLA